MADSFVDGIQPVPCQRSYDSVRCNLNGLLESDYRLSGSAAEDSVLNGSGNRGIILGDHVQEVLERDDVLPSGALLQQ